MPVDAKLTKLIQVYTTDAPDFPYTVTAFAIDEDTDGVITTTDENTGLSDEETFLADMYTAAAWVLVD